MTHRIFLLSPANAGGTRAQMVLKETADFDLAVRLRTAGASIGEVYAFVSGLYFRGKLAYARAFAAPPPGLPGSYVIAPGRGLVPPDTRITIADLREIANVPIDLAEPRYREPLERDVRILHEASGAGCEFLLLGSVATPKYVEPLVNVLGDRLVFPAEFAGRGDMSRGGLMLRCAGAGAELTYRSVSGGARRGRRPPKLPKLPKPKI